MRIDLNADVGESFGIYTVGSDGGLMRAITSANIAAGFHGGDPSVLRATIRLAKDHGVAVGAHPGFPDLVGFGRREMHLQPSEIEDLVLYQIAAVAGVAAAEGTVVRHVKPHGALYNMAAREPILASAVVRAVLAFDRTLVLFAPPCSALVDAAQHAGLTVALEAFVDRAYERTGQLVPRQRAGAVIHDSAIVVQRALDLAKSRTLVAVDGSVLPLDAETICLHGDTPGADRLATAVRAGLETAGVVVRAVTRP